jgi:hypothetical protein
MAGSEGEISPQGRNPRGEVMRALDEVAAMVRLRALGWGVRRIAGELGCSHMTVRRYLVISERRLPADLPAARHAGDQPVGVTSMVPLICGWSLQ